MLRAVIARASREVAPGRLATPGATGAAVTACAAAAAAGVGAGRPRAFTARPDTPPSVIPEHGDFSDSQSQVKQSGKERPLEGDAAEMRGHAEAEMAGRDNVAAEGARVMGSAHLQASHSPPQMNPRGASGGITHQNVSSADPSSSTGSDGALRQSDPAPPTGPGFSGDGTAAAGGGIGDGLSADYMNSTDAGEDVELMKGRLAQLERAGADRWGPAAGDQEPPRPDAHEPLSSCGCMSRRPFAEPRRRAVETLLGCSMVGGHMVAGYTFSTVR